MRASERGSCLVALAVNTPSCAGGRDTVLGVAGSGAGEGRSGRVDEREREALERRRARRRRPLAADALRELSVDARVLTSYIRTTARSAFTRCVV